ncbi:MarR family transcriptional regulator [Natronorubrum aibiense]|uniref:MarR family transcriptional regulator n=1 Tax=Natronorubrum aibiense TaxID=348826 RepID=A0A5P9P491_9EURY|nr:MarR family transcriptional regulator [Natronorubrum aibiense]QFU82953.1 MarR family transcriptional regulator [Natronorubrum aibiense]
MHYDGQSRSSVSIPTDLESPRAKLVYLYLSAWPTATTEELCTALDLNTGTVLSITSTLRTRGYLERTDSGFELA